MACGSGCLAAKIDAAAVPSSPVLMEARFSAPYPNYASPSNSGPMAYGICVIVGCNYRNVTVTMLTGDVSSKSDAVYSVVFYVMLPAGLASLTAFPSALSAALPSTSPSTPGTVAYAMSSAAGGALSTLAGLYPVPSLNSALPPAQWLPPPPPAGSAPPPIPRPPLPPPPSPPLPGPPSPPPPMAYSCTCTHGYSGWDCSIPPSL